MKLLALFIVLLLSGCAAPAPRGRTLDVSVPASDQLVVTQRDLPSFTLGSSDSPRDSPWKGSLDGSVVMLYQGDAEERVEIRTGAFRFETKEDAHAAFEQVATGIGENATRPAWGDEAMLTKGGDEQTFLRDRSVLFAASIGHTTPTNVTMAQLVAIMLAKMPPRGP